MMQTIQNHTPLQTLNNDPAHIEQAAAHHNQYASLNHVLNAAPGFQAIEEAPAHPTSRSGQTNNHAEVEEIHPPTAVHAGMRGQFAERHPILTKALAGIAASAVFAAAIVPLSGAYMIASPVRMLASALNVVSPRLGNQLLKAKAVQFLLGPFGSTLQSMYHDIEQAHPIGLRLTAGAVAIVDIGSAGTSFSVVTGGIKAFELAKNTFHQTQSKLGINELTQEMQAIQAKADQAGPLHETINKWFNILGDETPKTGLDENIWKGFESKFVPPANSASFLSLLLTQMFEGFPVNLLNSTKPQEQQEKQIQKDNLQGFVNNRLRPMLLDIQSSEKLADNAFKLAEIGLGACSDRAVFGYMAVELGTQSMKYTEQFSALSKTGNERTPEKDQVLMNLISTEMQKFRLNEVKKYADHVIQDAPRDPSQGGWQTHDRFIPYNSLDHVECYLTLCNEVQKVPFLSHWYPPMPYVKYGAGFNSEELGTLRNQVLTKMYAMEEDPNNTALLEHFHTTDAWQSVLEIVLPGMQEAKTSPLEYCQNAMSGLDDLADALSNSAQEYTKAADALNELRKKFNGEKITGSDAQLPLAEFITRQLEACEPIKVKADALLAQAAPIMEHAQKIESLWNKLSTDSSVFSQALEKAKKTYRPATNGGLTTRQLELQHYSLERIQAHISPLQTSGKYSPEQLKPMITNILQTNNSELLNTMIAMQDQLTQIRGAESYRDELQNIASEKSTNREKIEEAHKQFTNYWVSWAKNTSSPTSKTVQQMPVQQTATPAQTQPFQPQPVYTIHRIEGIEQ